MDSRSKDRLQTALGALCAIMISVVAVIFCL
jgi:hypothetical protein